MYLHLSDLRMALENERSDAEMKVLDFGCGGSPYRGLFSNADYRRADYLASEGLDYVVRDNSTIPERDGAFDAIMSTQVLEHVKTPMEYLKECRRLLKVGGRLICTTHGVFEEHGCPEDYHRWTADGIRVACEGIGLEPLAIRKLTTGPRAICFLMERLGDRLKATHDCEFSGVFNGIVNTMSKARATFHEWCDLNYSGNRVASADAGSEGLYIALMIVCQRPSGCRGSGESQD